MDKVFGAEDEYFAEVANHKKRLREMAGLNNIETNFVNKNVEIINDLAYIRNKQSLNRQMVEYRIQQAQQKAAYLEGMKIQKTQFDSIKWELYRQKVENIEDDYADFKKRQKKIFWWLQLILVKRCIMKSKYNFEKHKEKVMHDAVAMVKHVKITFWFRRFIRCKGPEREDRTKLWIRNSLSFLSNGRMQEAQD